MAENATFRSYLRAIAARWFTAMSGPLSVPLAIAAIFVEPVWQKIGLGLTAVAGAVFASYSIWKSERAKVLILKDRISEVESTRSVLDLRLENKEPFFVQDDGYGNQLWICHVFNKGPMVAENVRMRLIDIQPRPRSPLFARLNLPLIVIHVGGATEMGGARINCGDHEIFQIVSGQPTGVGFIVWGLGQPMSGQVQQFQMDKDERFKLTYRLTCANSEDLNFNLVVSITNKGRLLVEKGNARGSNTQT